MKLHVVKVVFEPGPLSTLPQHPKFFFSGNVFFLTSVFANHGYDAYVQKTLCSALFQFIFFLL